MRHLLVRAVTGQRCPVWSAAVTTTTTPGARTGTNRGPAAAADNRRRLVDAARRVFAEGGYHVPYRTIAQAAGVGQGSLYRHFPDRLDLAVAVFEDNLAVLERLAEGDDPGRFTRVWDEVVDQVVTSTALVEMFVDARRRMDAAGRRMEGRLRALVARPLADAQAAGLVEDGLTPDGVAMAVRMLHGVLVTHVDPATVPDAVTAALRLISPGLVPTTSPHTKEDTP